MYVSCDELCPMKATSTIVFAFDIGRSEIEFWSTTLWAGGTLPMIYQVAYRRYGPKSSWIHFRMECISVDNYIVKMEFTAVNTRCLGGMLLNIFGTAKYICKSYLVSHFVLPTFLGFVTLSTFGKSNVYILQLISDFRTKIYDELHLHIMCLVRSLYNIFHF